MLKLHCLLTVGLLVIISNSQGVNSYTTYGSLPNFNNVAANFENAYSTQTVNQGSYSHSLPIVSNVAPVPGNLIPFSGFDINQQYPTTVSNTIVSQTPSQLQPIQIQTAIPFQPSVGQVFAQSSIPIINQVTLQQPTPIIQTIQNSQVSQYNTLIPISTIQTTTTTIPLPTPVVTTGPVYGQIVIDQTGSTQTQMYAPNCANYINGVCDSCSFRFVRAFDGVCEPVNPLCATWNSNGACLTCYPGYEVCENGCIMSESCAPEGTYDPNCRNTVNGVCQQCSIGYYFNQNGICTQSNPFCRTSGNQGNCLSCYAGYGLSNGNCTVLPDPSNNNPFCTRWNNGICQSCSNSSWFNGNTCVPFDPMCSQTDRNNGNCLGCYSGYIMQAGKCYLNNNSQPTDLLCRRWNNNGVCIECSNNAYFNQNMCVAADPLCRSSNNGICLSCYAGYNLQNGRCIVILPDSGYQNTNQYCAIWDGTSCRQCAKNAYFNANRICTPTNPNCVSSGNFGQCLSCYNGYILQNNNCVINNSTVNVGNALCALWNGPTCQQCATRSFNYNGICTAVNTLCNTWNSFNGFCSSCYNGYILNGNTCTVNNQNVNNNPLCKTWNGANCIECATRTYLVATICTAVNENCNTWNSQNGQCISCYNGFALQGGACVQLPVQTGPSQSTDIYCSRTDSRGICTRCFYGFALQNGACIADFKNTSCGRNPSFCKN